MGQWEQLQESSLPPQIGQACGEEHCRRPAREVETQKHLCTLLREDF